MSESPIISLESLLPGDAYMELHKTLKRISQEDDAKEKPCLFGNSLSNQQAQKMAEFELELGVYKICDPAPVRLPSLNENSIESLQEDDTENQLRVLLGKITKEYPSYNSWMTALKESHKLRGQGYSNPKGNPWVLNKKLWKLLKKCGELSQKSMKESMPYFCSLSWNENSNKIPPQQCASFMLEHYKELRETRQSYSVWPQCGKIRLEADHQKASYTGAGQDKVLEEMHNCESCPRQGSDYLINTSPNPPSSTPTTFQLGLKSNGTPLHVGPFTFEDHNTSREIMKSSLPEWELCPKLGVEDDLQKAANATEQEKLIRRKRKGDERLAVSEESRPGERKKAMLRRMDEAKHGSHKAIGGSNDQTINYDNPTSPSFTKNSENQTNVTDARPYKLILSNNIFQQVHTGQPIKGEDGHSLSVKLVNCQSGELVTSIPEASARVEIVVLGADFGEDSCSREGFKSKTVLREGNKPLLTGNVIVQLKEGIACLSTVRFSQCRTWRSMCDYRLGAIALDDDDMGAKIKEGVTGSFVVKDGRLRDNKKGYPLTLDSQVWRLAKIAKDGPFHHRLSIAEIYTAGDFLKELKSNSEKLRDVLGPRMHSGMWLELKAHAKTLEVDESTKFPTVESSSLTSIRVSSQIEGPDISQPVDSFNFKESIVDNPSLGIGMRRITILQNSPLQEGNTGGEILISSDIVGLDSPQLVIPSQINSDLDQNMQLSGTHQDHVTLDDQGYERPLQSPVGFSFILNGNTLASPNYPQIDGNGPIDEFEPYHQYFSNDSPPTLDENTRPLDQIWNGIGHGNTHRSSA